jgi:hypothetical protein
MIENGEILREKTGLGFPLDNQKDHAHQYNRSQANLRPAEG